MTRALAFAPALAWALVILWIGSRPDLAPPIDTDLPIDKLGHFAVFAVLGGLIAWALHRADVRASVAWPLLAGLAIGALDELNQRTVPGRSADVWDLVADAAGLAFGLWLAHRALERREQRLAADFDARRPTPDARIQEHRA